MVDAGDLKSPPGNRVRVRVPPLALERNVQSATREGVMKHCEDENLGAGSPPALRMAHGASR